MVDVVGVGLAALAALGVAGQALFVRVGTQTARSTDALVIVFAVNLAIVGPVTLVTHYPDYGLTRLALLAFAGAGLFGMMAGRILLFEGISRVGASRAEPIKSSMPLFATVSAVILLGETLTPSHLAGIVLIVAGVGLVSWEGSRRMVPDVGTNDRPGVWLAVPLVAAFFFGLEPIFAKVGFQDGTPYLVGVTIKVATAMVVFTAYLAANHRLPRPHELRGDGLRWLLAAGVSSTLFLVAYYAALVRAPVVIVVPIMQSSPLLVVLISLLFLQRIERVSWRLGAAASVIVIGAILVSLSS